MFSEASGAADSKLRDLLAQVAGPVLIISTKVGRGMFSLGEAIAERIPPSVPVEHLDIESLLPARGLQEDLERYRLISCRWPWLLNIVYRVPIFYYRKYLRERLAPADLSRLAEAIDRFRPVTVICVSHRPAFWLSALKHRSGARFELWGVLGELGDTLGWRYLFWNSIDHFLSPVPAQLLSCRLPDRLQFSEITLPARSAFEELRTVTPDRRRILLVCGYWGQGPVMRVARQILESLPDAEIDVVCGENADLYTEGRRVFQGNCRVTWHGSLESIVPLMRMCAAVVTKPGISTLLEAHASRRKIFLLPGMPVAEDNNARYAIRNFDAEWFSAGTLRSWSTSQRNSNHGLLA